MKPESEPSSRPSASRTPASSWARAPSPLRISAPRPWPSVHGSTPSASGRRPPKPRSTSARQRSPRRRARPAAPPGARERARRRAVLRGEPLELRQASVELCDVPRIGAREPGAQALEPRRELAVASAEVRVRPVHHRYRLVPGARQAEHGRGLRAASPCSTGSRARRCASAILTVSARPASLEEVPSSNATAARSSRSAPSARARQRCTRLLPEHRGRARAPPPGGARQRPPASRAARLRAAARRSASSSAPSSASRRAAASWSRERLPARAPHRPVARTIGCSNVRCSPACTRSAATSESSHF